MMGKVSKQVAHYRSEPKDGKKCSACEMFRSPNRCTAVEGDISASGWGHFYKKRADMDHVANALRIASDNVAFSDTVQRQADFRRLAFDTLALADTVLRQADARRLTSDSLALADAALRQVNFRRLTIDSAALSDTVQRSVIVHKLVSDSLAMSDVVTLAIILSLAISIVQFTNESVVHPGTVT